MPFDFEEHGDTGSDPELTIRIIAPQEFAGSIMGLLNHRGGFVTGIDAQQGAVPEAVSQKLSSVIIRGSLPGSQYAALVEEIVEATLGRGNVEIQSPPDNHTRPTRGG
jgi:translation elongation factor EF-G